MFTTEQVNLIERLLQEGHPPSSVAKELGVSRPTLEKRLLKQGIEIEPCPTWKLRSVVMSRPVEEVAA